MKNKAFEELTIVDDYLFYKVLQDLTICKRLLGHVLKEQIGEIADVEYQKTIHVERSDTILVSGRF
ncbi:MAG: hypothetical protein IJQ12_06575 [Lachnospiraceae bacterium]|nr:hypothetical protein [Lachnospiraceae bacterium]